MLTRTHPLADIVGFTNWYRPHLERPKFIFQDLNSEWHIKQESCDLIHGNGLIGHVEYPVLARNAFRLLRTGGYFEFSDRLFHYATANGKELDAENIWSRVSTEVESYLQSIGRFSPPRD